MKLLLVDDEPIIVRGLARLLDYQALGFSTVIEATSSIQARALIAESPPDVLLSDIVMPDYSGLDLLRQLRSEGLDTKVIFLSGYQDFSYAQEALSLGAVGYLLKPVEQDKLAALLAKAKTDLEHSREKDAIHRKLQSVSDVPAQQDSFGQLASGLSDEDKTWYCLLGVKLSRSPERGAVEENLLRFSMYNKADSYAQSHGGVAFVKDDHLVILCKCDRPEQLRETASQMGEEIVSHVQQTYHQPLWFVTGEVFQQMHKIPEMHKRLTSQMDTHEAVIPQEVSTLDKVKDYIQNHYHEALSLEVMASIACVHATYFSAYFRRHMGMGFKTYLTQTRIQVAQQLLQNNELKVYEIAERVGFSDPRHFSDTFRKVTGSTPQQYRDMLAANPIA